MDKERIEELEAMNAPTPRTLNRNDLRRFMQRVTTDADVCDHDLNGNPITNYDVLYMGAYGACLVRLINAVHAEASASRAERADAMFVWRRFIDDSGQTGINCAVFRNESGHQSSELIRQADAIADFCWPDSRHYTFVKASAVKSANPGYCFIMAGWKRCGMTKSGLLVLERMP